MAKVSRRLFLLLALLPLTAIAAEKKQPEITLVYWGSGDCPYCRKWETMEDGGEKAFLASSESKAIRYYRVKNARLADEYQREHFPAGLEWLWERYEWKDVSHPFRPGWHLYLDRKLVENASGAANWQQKVLPRLKELLSGRP